MNHNRNLINNKFNIKNKQLREKLCYLIRFFVDLNKFNCNVLWNAFVVDI